MGERLDHLEAENRRLSRVCDSQEIQNVMALHEFYHASFAHELELDSIWAQQAEDASFEESLFNSRFVGMDAITGYYVEFMKNTLFKSATPLITELYPQLKDAPGQELPFGMAFMHTLTTHVIEVAEDGATAKGVWISPGYTTMPTFEKLQAYWHWDRYAVDFIKEDGQWKIWHFFVGREFTCRYDKSWVDTGVDGEEAYELALEVFRQWPGYNEYRQEPINTFSSYSPFEVPRLQPRLPEPYATFSETFSY
jgi:hypothetical protein